MNKKAQELELRNIMQGLEEFATFMSFRGNSNGLRILSVESVAQSDLAKPQKQTGRVIHMSKPQSNLHIKQSAHKSLLFQDRDFH